jgi:hypothetical protein
MEYFLGSLVTVLIIAGVLFGIRKLNIKLDTTKIQYSQTHIYNIIERFVPSNQELTKPIKTQSSVHWDKSHIRILILGSKAYWIKDHAFYVADIVDGEIDEDSTTQVDTMTMNEVQLNKMLHIVEELTRGSSNDYWDSGKS